MNPAFSVLLLTTLIGAAQGLFIALHALEWLGWAGRGGTGLGFFALGGAAVLVLTGGGLVASFFHLGRPERAWRTATMWRTSWLSREVIVLPLFMLGAFVWTVRHYVFGSGTLWVGAATVALALALFVCTAMIYASLRFIQEWASAYTVVNYTLLGLASGATAAAALAGVRAPALVPPLAQAALALGFVALVTRGLSLRRNARLVPRSTLQTAVGIRHPQLRQRSMGFMGGSFNTREFFHGRSAGTLRWVRWAFVALAFALPMAGLAGVAWRGFGDVANQWLLLTVALVQMGGLLAERWFFFAQANHPQNLYYQAVS
ncbi:MAG: dimethyl sulfoxide reductase anchor subunit [Rubrivivax sp.]|nr:dimethyl sulfoxide reductase anchor subunit [Rubrivivax sp.]